MEVGQQALLLLVHRVKTETGFATMLRLNPEAALDETLANNELELSAEERSEVLEWAQARAIVVMGGEATNRLVQRLRSDAFFAGQYALDRDSALDTILAQFQLDLPDSAREGVFAVVDKKFGKINETMAAAEKAWGAFLRNPGGVEAVVLFPSARQPKTSTAFIQKLDLITARDGAGNFINSFVPRPNPAGVAPPPPA